MAQCPICKKGIVQPRGNKKSQILVIAPSPTLDDLKSGYPFAGVYGNIMRMELGKWGVDLFQLRYTCLWLHDIVKKDEAEREWHMQQAIQEAIGKEAVLMLGSEVVGAFFPGLTATAVSGIPMKADLLSAPLVMGTLNPLSLIQGSHGEFSMAIYKFCNIIKERSLYG
jgi:uracil-DNA glycosylase